ncbi:unnamed protein product, partial [Brenthis ino]
MNFIRIRAEVVAMELSSILNTCENLFGRLEIPASAANLIENSQLRRRYYSAQVYAQTQRALSIPVTLILQWDDRSKRVKHRQLPNSGLLLKFTIEKDSITKLGPTRNSNPGPPWVQPYMLATTPPRQLLLIVTPACPRSLGDYYRRLPIFRGSSHEEI